MILIKKVEISYKLCVTHYLIVNMSNRRKKSSLGNPGATIISGSSFSTNYCGNKKTQKSTSEFLKTYVKEFISASMDQHKACVTKTIHKV